MGLEVGIRNSKDRAKEQLMRNLGPEILCAFNDPRTIEIMLNPDGAIWVERLGEEMQLLTHMPSFQAQAIIELVAGYHSKEVTRSQPILEGSFPLGGARFAGQLPPVVSAPTFAIRKKAISIFTLDDYVAAGMLSAKQRDFLQLAVKRHKNILVVGGTGSGKTTLVNALIQAMVTACPQERIIIIEDTGEIQCSAVNSVQFYTNINTDLTALLKASLRMRPDRILVGEVRGGEALDLLDAWNTGHEGGVATLHANNVYAALGRLRSLVTRNKAAPSDIETLIAEVVHIVVYIEKTKTGRKIQSILEIEGYSSGKYETKLFIG